MNGIWKDDARILAAKKILVNLVDSLKTYKNLELALRVYGHQYPKSQQNCTDTRLETSFGANNTQAIKEKLEEIEPKGVTPLAYSLEQCASDFPKQKDVRNIVVIITDGLESCQGDPCRVSLSLQKKNIFLKPFVVGIGMEKDYSQEFGCIGTFYNATDPSAFRALLQKVISQALAETQVRVDLLDGWNKATESNVNVSFENALTGRVAYDFVHFMAPNGKPDLLDIDPVITYDIRVNTIPATYQKNVYLEGGKLNVIEIAVPQGHLSIQQKSWKEYNGLTVLIKKEGNGELVHTYQVGQEDPKLLTGTYELEILTLPRIQKRVQILNQKTTTIQLPQPGIVSVLGSKEGYGSIYEIKPSSQEEWIYNLPILSNGTSLAMQPGQYKVVYRSKNAIGSQVTYVNQFVVRSGSSTTVKLFD